MGNLCCCCPTWTRKESEIVCPQPQPNSDVQQVTSEIRNLSVQDQQIQPTVINQQPAKKLEKSVSDGATVLRNSTVRSNSSVRSKTAVPAAIIVPQQKSVVTKHPNPLTKPKLVCVRASNLEFIANIIEDYAEALNWDDLNYKQSQLHFIKLDHYSCEYEDVESQFNSTNKRCFEITQIHRIQNPYLLAAFLLKKKEMSKRIGSINIEELFHGTKRAYVRSICTDNFDWRRCGESVGNKFGHGISFSPISNYATYYADESCDNRVMLLVHVLVGNEIIGSANMRLPPDGYDTSIKPNRHVVVKYEDNEFYPAYKITYRCTNPRELENRRLQKRKNGRGRGRGPRQVARQRYYN